MSAPATVFTASCTVIANGTIDLFSPEAQYRRNLALAVSRCQCGHQRNLHYKGNVTTPGFDWRGGNGPCQKKKCKCRGFSAPTAVAEVQP